MLPSDPARRREDRAHPAFPLRADHRRGRRRFPPRDPTMQQRIVRAKKRIAKTGIPFGRPGPDELVDRLPGVLRVISLIFTHGINATSGATHTRVDLQKEAIRLARLLAELLPAETEVRGLLALLLLTHARDR